MAEDLIMFLSAWLQLTDSFQQIMNQENVQKSTTRVKTRHRLILSQCKDLKMII